MGIAVQVGVNDVATVAPHLVPQWHPELNDDVLPTMVSRASREHVWWVCPTDTTHVWRAVIATRVNGIGCPYCSGRQAIPGVNDIATSHPHLVREWSPRNSMSPDEVKSGSGRKIWWRCELEHEWQAPPLNRTRHNAGCPYCANRYAWPGFNDLATIHPDLAAEWHPTKNGTLTPGQVVAKTDRPVWWQCKEGHSWRVRPTGRISGSGCPTCANRLLLTGFNDLASTFPQIAAEWHPTRNGALTPEMIVHGSTQRIWWQCSEGHEWIAFVYNRTLLGNGCPTCAGQRPEVGVSDFATTHAMLAAQLHPELNNGLKATDFMANTEIRVWWLCPSGHSWRGMVPSRTRRGNECPQCTGLRQGFRAGDPGILYFIASRNYRARKVGIANSSDRVRRFGEDWELKHRIVHPSGHVIAAAERRLLRWLRNDLLLPPYLGHQELGKQGGWTETFAQDEGPSDHEVIQRMIQLVESAEAEVADPLFE